MPRHSLIALAVLLAGCTINAGVPVTGWPRLEVVEHYVTTAEMRNRCAPYVGFGMLPEACAEIDLAAKRCDLWFSNEFRPSSAILAHEREHCEGYDHIGQTQIADMLKRWRAKE